MAARLVLAYILAVVFAACEKEQPCTYENEVKLISDTTSHWFENATRDTTLPVTSSKGRSESYHIEHITYISGGSLSDCKHHFYEYRRMQYSSSLFGNNFHLLVTNSDGPDLFTLNSQFLADRRCEINISTKTTNCDLFDSYSSRYSTQAFSKIDTFVIDGTALQGTYKIEFATAWYSFDKKTKIIYINPQYGLLKFETFDGEVWSLY